MVNFGGCRIFLAPILNDRCKYLETICEVTRIKTIHLIWIHQLSPSYFQLFDCTMLGLVASTGRSSAPSGLLSGAHIQQYANEAAAVLSLRR